MKKKGKGINEKKCPLPKRWMSIHGITEYGNHAVPDKSTPDELDGVGRPIVVAPATFLSLSKEELFYDPMEERGFLTITSR